MIEVQTRPDADKIDVLLEGVAGLRAHARHGAGKYDVLPAMVHLTGRPPTGVVDMRLPDGRGGRHAPLLWNVADDGAAAAARAVESGGASWGLLFWVPLMAGVGDNAVVDEWKRVTLAEVSDSSRRGDLAGVALVFAELAGCLPTWKKCLGDFDVTESVTVNEWTNQGREQGQLEARRNALLEALNPRFPDQVTDEVVTLVNESESPSLLSDLTKAASTAEGFDAFLKTLRG